MGFTLPAAIASLLTTDSSTNRALQSIKVAVDPLLQTVGSCLEVLGDGTLRIKRVIKNLAASDPTFSGLVSTDRMRGTRFDVGALVVYTYLNCLGPIVSATGFRSCFDMGWAWASGATVGTKYRTSNYVQNQEGNNTFKMVTLFQPQTSGSITGVQAWNQGGAGGNVNVQLFKNVTVTTGTPLLDVSLGSAAANVGNTVGYAKGVYAFNALDYYIATVTWTVAGNQATQVRLFYEMAA